jgi:hypothetical protein
VSTSSDQESYVSTSLTHSLVLFYSFSSPRCNQSVTLGHGGTNNRFLDFRVQGEWRVDESEWLAGYHRYLYRKRNITTIPPSYQSDSQSLQTKVSPISIQPYSYSPLTASALPAFDGFRSTFWRGYTSSDMNPPSPIFDHPLSRRVGGITNRIYPIPNILSIRALTPPTRTSRNSLLSCHPSPPVYN